MLIFGHSKFLPVFLYQNGLNKFGMCIFGLAFLNLYQYLGKLLEKIQNSHLWPFQIYTSLFGENCQKKLGMAKNGHSKFIPVFLSEKNCWKKFRTAIFVHFKFIPVFLSEKIQNSHFCPFQIYISHFGKNCQKKLGMAIFGHSKFILVFLEKMAIPNLYQSFLRKIVGKNSEQPFLSISNLYQCFCQKKIQNSHFLPFQIYTSHFGENCQKKMRMAIFGRSEFIPVFLEKIVRKNLEWPFFGHSEFFSDNSSVHITLIECTW